ncbi:helix-turn-helix transcriptional regulator [Nocardia sp. AB354]|uniref:helix-turn-helix transcriptional regulator n=1 Tax=Nocardia sp. AB354 TaxID=3413283 RepID=UPI003C180088
MPVYLTREEVADRLQLSPRTLSNWKAKGKGPKCIRIEGGRVRYLEADFIDWLRQMEQQP